MHITNEVQIRFDGARIEALLVSVVVRRPYLKKGSLKEMTKGQAACEDIKWFIRGSSR